MHKKIVKKGYAPYVVMGIIMMIVLLALDLAGNNVHELTYDKFNDYAKSGEIKEILITPKERAGVYEVKGMLNSYEEGEVFIVTLPLTNETIAKIYESQSVNGFELATQSDPESSTFLMFLVNVLPTILLIGIAFFFITRQMGTANKSMDFGKSKAKLHTGEKKINFNNVAGLKEEKEEVQELIDFLRAPKKFTDAGARIPKGVLLVGPPGTGKTLLAEAVAGEANVPFYYISGSDFVELFVGVGASRVRDMFKQAKHNAPCLIFIDEIDAVGRQRGTGLGGGHDEREQTLNQLLTEMDGFGQNEGIIIIAATNRPDVLDPALLRPGRFDRQITVDLPDVTAREEILAVHARNKKLREGVTLKNISRRTPGFSGADLENLLNEAALLSVRENRREITMADIDEAMDRVMMGPAKKSKKYTEEERKMVAYHEAGHAVIGIKLKEASNVQKVTIIPRGKAGGYNLMLPEKETFTKSKTQMLHEISSFLGGRVAEELIFDEISTGAYGDISSATKIARAMVTEYGMSSLGLIQYEQHSGNVFLGRDYNKSKNFSDKVAHEIDEEVRAIIAGCYETATEIIKANLDLLALIAETLLEKETLTKEEIDELVETGKLSGEVIVKPSDLSNLTLAELKEKAKTAEIKGYSKMNKDELIEKLRD